MVKFQQWNSIKPSIHIAKRSPILLELERKLERRLICLSKVFSP